MIGTFKFGGLGQISPLFFAVSLAEDGFLACIDHNGVLLSMEKVSTRQLL